MTTGEVIRLTNVHFSWGEEAVLDLDLFTLARGEKLFLGGPSGCGKSSMLSILSGVAVPQKGTVELLGKEISEMNGPQRDAFRADHIGYIFQMFNLIPYLSVVENVTLPLRYSKRKNARVDCPSTEAHRLLGQLGMEGLVERRVIDLSVGQQQRVAAARALMGAPEIVLADEPTSSLDKGHSEQFLDLLFEECDSVGSTLIFVSHDECLSDRFDNKFLLGGATS